MANRFDNKYICPICRREHTGMTCDQFERLQHKAKVSAGKLHGIFDNRATKCREVYV